MALNKRERILLNITITAIVLGANYLLIAPLVGKWKTFGGTLSTRRHELAAMTATIQREPEWHQQYDQLRQNLNKQSVSFEQTSDVLKKINEVGASSGILIQQIRPIGQPVEKDVYRELPVQCTFESTTESLVKFLYGLQTSSGFVSVEELRITPRADNNSILRCDIQIRALAAKAEATTS
ncbi:MAG TPA: type II secretion system protein GspM [Verrucomicrobiae bacterium]|nr:type II secretion system protein GspM [Verrucomicrobiae bacterium]